MFRLILTWVFLTAILTGFIYVVDRRTKDEVKKWSVRFAQSGIAVAIILSLIVFIERL